MSDIDALVDHPFVLQWGWVLVHFLWQGAILAALAGVLLACTANASARLRYLVATGCLFAAAALPVVTWMSLDSVVPATNASAVTTGADRELPQAALHATLRSPAVDSAVEVTSNDADAAPHAPGQVVVSRDEPAIHADASRGATRSLVNFLEPALPWCVLCWTLGVLCLSLRLLGGAYLTGRLMTSAEPLRDGCVSRMQRYLVRLAIPQTVRWLESARIQVPQVTGWYKPVIMVPTSIFTTLTPDEIESLLLHELVHLRRYDFLVNVLQCAIETVLFFHPGIHWLSRRVRLERELACDEEVIRLTGDRFTYSRALLSLAEQPKLPHPALAASDGDLSTRIRAVLGMKRSGAARSVVAFIVPAVCLVVFAAILIGRHQLTDTEPTKNTPARGNSAAPVIERFLADGLPVPELSGTVVDASGDPVGGATVYLRQSARSSHGGGGGPLEWLDLARATTDDRGRFAFTDVLDHKDGRLKPAYDIVVLKADYAIAWKHARPNGPVKNIRVTLQSPVRLKGRVVDGDGQPQSGARVTLKHLMSIRHITQADLEDGRWPSWTDARFASFHGFREAFEATTDETGRFELNGIAAGSGAFLEVAHPEHLIKNAYAATVDQLDPETAAKTKRDVQTGEISVALKPGYRIRAVVRDAETGELIPNVRYAMTHQSYRLPPRHVADNGIIEVNHLSSPKFWLIVFPPEESRWLAYHQHVSWSEDERLKQVEVNLRHGVKVGGRVTDQETGEGVPDVSVVTRATGVAFEHHVPRQYTASPGTTDRDGYFTIYCPPGDHEFAARGRIKGFLNPREVGAASQTVSVTADGPQSAPEITLTPAPRFRLVVTDPDGRPAVGVSIRARAHSALNSYFSIEGLTDEYGEYLLDELFMAASPVQELLEEEVVLRDPTGRFGARLLLKRPGEDAPLEQRIEAPLQRLGTVVGRTVDDESGRPVAGTSVALYKRDHVPLGASWTGETVTTGDDGTFELHGVFPGVGHSLSMRHTRFKTPNGVHLQFELSDDSLHDFGDIQLGSLAPPPADELAQVEAPDLSGLTPQQALERLDASYMEAFQTYRQEIEELEPKYSIDDIVARREPTPAYANAYLALAQADPQSDVALRACLWISSARRIAGSEEQSRETRAAAAKILQQHFLDRPEMADCISIAITAQINPEDRTSAFARPELLADAVERLIQANEHRDVHARACFYLVERLMQHLTGWGYPHFSRSQEMVDLCREYLQRIQGDFPEYDHYIYGTYGEAAKRYLFDLDHMLVGKTPPDLTGTDVTGRPVKLSDYRGKLVIVDFWHASFDPVNNEYGGLRQILEKAGNQVALLGIVDSPAADVLQAVEKHNIDYPVIADGDDGPLFTLWNVHAWPTTFLLDENGVILHRGHRGTSLENILVEHLAKMASER